MIMKKDLFEQVKVNSFKKPSMNMTSQNYNS